MNTYKTGLFAEWIARNYLRLCGYKILARRYVIGPGTGRAEIDIIAKKGDLVIFVEVKNRKTVTAGLEAVTWAQSDRLRATAEHFLRMRRHIGPARFDVIVVMRPWRVNWVKGAI